MEFTPVTYQVSSILNSGRKLVIPRFQRAYCWDDRNNATYLTDICNRISVDDEGNVHTKPYFIGTMLFMGTFTGGKDAQGVSASNVDGSDQKLEVIDGQQRLTSITILLSALSSAMRDLATSLEQQEPVNQALIKRCGSAASMIFSKYIEPEDNDGEQFSVIETKTSYPYFAQVVQTPPEKRQPVLIKDDDSLSEEELAIKNAYSVYEKMLKPQKLSGLINGAEDLPQNGELYFAVLKAIRDVVLGSNVIVISMQDRTTANLIFEILNGKGVHLASLDLIKNKIFEKVPTTSPNDMAADAWKDISETLQAGPETAGFATFYRHYWESRSGKKTGINQLYDKFAAEFEDADEQAYIDFLVTLKDEARNYHNILNPLRENYGNRKEYYPVVQAMRELSNFNIDQARIGLLALCNANRYGGKSKKDVISGDTFARAARAIEYFHFAYTAVCHSPANRLEPLYAKFAYQLRGAQTKGDAKQVLKEYLFSQFQQFMPDREAFIAAYIRLAYNGTKRISGNISAKYAVNLINEYLEERPIFADDSSVEHLLPEQDADAEPKLLSIGNLIALETNLNGKAGNLPYEKKCETVYPRSKYRWVERFRTEHRTWSVEEIDSRARAMAELTYDKIIKPYIDDPLH